MEEQVFDIIASEIQKFGSLINWTFSFTFIMTAYLVNEISKSQFKAKVKTWIKSLSTGIILAALFFVLSKKYDLQEVIRYIVSIVFSMFILWDGLKKRIKKDANK